MTQPSKNVWYKLGYALESARQQASAVEKVSKKSSKADGKAGSSAVDQLLAVGGGALAHTVISTLAGRRPGTLRLARAALAGAGAAFVLSLLRRPDGSSGEKGTTDDPALYSSPAFWDRRSSAASPSESSSMWPHPWGASTVSWGPRAPTGRCPSCPLSSPRTGRRRNP